jgi:hypothetical protein
MTPDKWAALREPFPAEQIEHLPRGGRQLAYVSHGHVTDRLLQVDPEYLFGPVLDKDGVPIVVLDGLAPGDNVGVWGVLTVLGTSVVEFCSGKDLMDAYSRCLCRAAMRRGVALDLWIGDDLKPEVRKEGGLGDAPVPKSWAQVKAWHETHGDWKLAEEMSKAFMIHQFGSDNSKSLAKEERAVVLQKAAGATVWLAEHGTNAVGPLPITVELYQRAWAAVMDGTVLEGIEWQPPEPPADADAEAERLADEAIAGPPA